MAESQVREQAMVSLISEVAKAAVSITSFDPWSPDIKATDDFLHPLFKTYFQRLNLRLNCKSDYHILAGLVPRNFGLMRKSWRS